MGGLIASLAPGWALKRALARVALERLYKAAGTSNARVRPTDTRSGDAVMDHARGSLRQWGRHLDENHDLTHSILNTLSYQASAVRIEPRVLNRGGAPVERINEELRRAWHEWQDSAEVSVTLCWQQFAALVARTWLRDGESFVQHMLGADLNFPTAIPYAIEAHEPDLVPFEMLGEVPLTVHGIEIDRRGRPIAYRFYRTHPGDTLKGAGFETETIRVPADQVSHLKIITRLGQKRGASVLASAITRLSDVTDYEESERLAAKIAASLCAAITRGADFASTTTSLDASSGERPMEFQSGMIFDNLLPGERVEVLNTSRPNPELGNYRKAMLQAATAGIGVSYSTSTHDYDGTYSSQRQELVEVQQAYAHLRCQFVALFYRPIWQRFVRAVQLADLISMAGADPRTLADFEAIAPPSPWIDPQKEASADKIAIEAKIESRHGVIRKRGGDPRRVDDEIEADTMSAEPEPEIEEAPDADQEPEEAAAA